MNDEDIKRHFNLSDEDWERLDQEGRNCFILPYKWTKQLEEVTKDGRFL